MTRIVCGIAVILVGVLLPEYLQARQAAPPTLALTNVTVIDGTGAGPVSGMTIVIADGRIRDLFSSAERQPPEGARVIELSGSFIIPGLINSHVHFTPLLLRDPQRAEAELKRMLYGGVTSVRDTAGNQRLLADLQRSIRAREVVGPDLHYSALVAGPEFLRRDQRVAMNASASIEVDHPALPIVATPEMDAQAAVARAVDSGATGLKFYEEIDADVIRELAEEAHLQGLMVWAHTTVFPDRPIDVIRAGVDAVSHVCNLAWQSEALDPGKASNDPRPAFDAAKVDVGANAMELLFAEMVQRGTILDATASLLAVRGGGAEAAPSGCTAHLNREIAAAAANAGVAFATGTDYFVPLDDPFPSLFGEIEYLIEEGILTPLQVITAATLNGARVLGIDNSHGTVELGKVANLVVLDSDPSQDIAAIRSIVMVIKEGVTFRRADFDQQR